MERPIDRGSTEKVESDPKENPQQTTAADSQARGSLQIASNSFTHSAPGNQPLSEQVQKPCPGDAEEAHSEPSHPASGDNHTPPETPETIPENPHSSRQNDLEGQPPKGTPEDKADASERAHDLSPWPPLVMISCFLLGLTASISHHLFYSHLDDTIAYENVQQWNLRAGTAFAWIIKAFLDACVWQAYTQWLWRALENNYMSMRRLDSALGVRNSLPDLIHVLFSKAKVGALLAVIAWCLTIPSIFAPGTLIINPSTSVAYVETQVPSLGIGGCNNSHEFAYYPEPNPSAGCAGNGSFTFVGPRTVITRISTAAASQGAILSIQPPFNNTSYSSQYSIQFVGPWVRCSSANSSVTDFMNAYLVARNKTLLNASKEHQFEKLAYAAFVPSFNTSEYGNISISFNGIEVTALDQPRLQQQPSNATNELWLYYWGYSIDQNGDYVLVPNETDQRYLVRQYSVCSLWNATYNLTFSFDAGVQSVTNNGVTPLNPVPYPIDDQSSDVVQLSYSAVFWTLADQLVGTMGLVMGLQKGIWLPSYGSINTLLQSNILLGSNNLDYFFDINSASSNASNNSSIFTTGVQSEWNPTLSWQRVLDKSLAQNQTLPNLIEQLSFNVTVSFLTDPLLAPPVTTNTTKIIPVNRYAYNVRGLWIFYGLANFFTMLALSLGILAIILNKGSHQFSFSNLLSITRDPSLATLFKKCTHGIAHLPRDTLNSELMIKRMEGGGLSLQPKDQGNSDNIVCEYCKRQERRRSSQSTSVMVKTKTVDERPPV